MLADSFTKWLWDRRRSIVTWTVAVAAVGGFYAAFWPTIDSPDMRNAIENYPSGLLEALNYTDIATPSGYLSATVYGLVVAALVIVYSVSAGARLVAGDEEAGTLDLILAHPVSRSRLALQRYAALVVSLVTISLGLLVVIVALVKPFDLTGISFGDLLAMHLHLVLFGMVFGAMAYAAGAATGRRTSAIGAGAVLAVFGFAANGILPQVDGLEWIDRFSPFAWLNGGSPLQNGLQFVDLSIMVVLVVVLVAAGTVAFERRDVSV